MIFDVPTDMFFSLNPSTGSLQGSKHYTNYITVPVNHEHKMIEHDKTIYINFAISNNRLTAYSMTTGSFTTSVVINNGNYITTIIEGKQYLGYIIDDVYLYMAGRDPNDYCYLAKVAFTANLGKDTGEGERVGLGLEFFEGWFMLDFGIFGGGLELDWVWYFGGLQGRFKLCEMIIKIG
jgi:hypothetical protein